MVLFFFVCLFLNKLTNEMQQFQHMLALFDGHLNASLHDLQFLHSSPAFFWKQVVLITTIITDILLIYYSEALSVVRVIISYCMKVRERC